MDVNIKKAAEILRSIDDVGILVHRNPDGDCLGGGYGLCLILRALGKRARVLSCDTLAEKFSKRFAKYDTEEFEPQNYVAVDVAVPELLGENSFLAPKVLLCIDHHPTNSRYAFDTFLESDSAAACELVYMLIKELNVEITRDIATALYIGILTDTGCFQFSNTSSRTHIIAAELMALVPDFADINRDFFATKSKGRMLIERLALEKLHYYHDDKVAIMPVTREMRDMADVDDSELDGIAPIPCRIEGVEIGVTIREKENDIWRVSVRTASYADASSVCVKFGGGGHVRASGCTVKGSLDEVEKMLADACGEELNK